MSVFEALAGCAVRSLIDDAVEHDGRCNWLGDDIDELPTPHVVHRSMDAALYDGTAGIGWVLSWWAAGRCDRDAEATGRAALAHAHSWAIRSTEDGLAGGRSGVALALASAGAALRCPALMRDAVELASAVVAAGAAGAVSGEVDLLGGDSGVAAALFVVADLAGGPAADELRSHALKLCARVEQAAIGTTNGRWWYSPGAGAALCGLAHGASGIALVLRRAGDRYGLAPLVAAADNAESAERAWFDSDRGGWPDLRGSSSDDDPEQPGYEVPFQWCHGSAGIGLVRLDTHASGGNRQALAEAAAAIEHVTAQTLCLLARPERSFAANACICHGVGGAAELHLRAAQATGDRTHLHLARRLMLRSLGVERNDVERWMAANPAVGPDEIRGAADRITCGIPGAGATPGLFVGLAGTAAVLARLHCPDSMPSPAMPWTWADS